MARPATRWITLFARAGYSARGLVYSVIGLFAILAAVDAGAKKDSKDAIQTLLAQPFGGLIVWALIAGLAGYTMWRLIQAIADTDEHGANPKGLAIRSGLLVSAFTYGALALYALALLGVFAGSQSTQSDSGRSSIASAFAAVVGNSNVALGLSAILLGVAGAHFWKAWNRKYRDHFDAGAHVMRFVDPASIIGLTARGSIFLILAILLFYRFLNAGRASAAPPGLEAALQFLQQLPFGRILLAATGVGLLAFSVYSFMEARWRRINLEAP